MTDHRALIAAVRDLLGPARSLTDPARIAGFARDWTGAHLGSTTLVALPRDAEEVAALVALAREHGAALVPQGGNTGLVAGGVPMHGEIVLSTRHLSAAPEVDVAAATVTAGAGAPVQTVQEAAAAHRLTYGVDLASRGSASIGGTVATNAGGLRVMAHGDTRTQLLGVEAVLGTGEIVRRTNGLRRDNSGYHLPSLLAGSEGTLAVLTAVQLRLLPAPGGRAVALLAFESATAAVTAAQHLRRACRAVSAVELMLAGGLDLVGEQSGRRLPLAGRPPAVLLVETTADSARRAHEVLVEATASLAGQTSLLDAVFDDVAGGRRLWFWRESHTECISRIGTPVKLDLTLPAGALAEFVESVPGIVSRVAPGARTWLFGHVADGNVHVNVTGTSGHGPAAQALAEAVFTDVARRGGSISTEHGIGTAKRRWLHLMRSDTEIAAQRRIKRALDPDGVLNPNVLLP